MTHPILTDPETEPEAAHLRGVLREIKHLLSSRPSAVPRGVLTEIDEALKRPATNGAVIDALQAQVAELEGQIEDVRLEAHVPPQDPKNPTRVANDAMLCAFDLCILSVETFAEVYPKELFPEGEFAYARHVLEKLLGLLRKLREQYTEDA